VANFDSSIPDYQQFAEEPEIGGNFGKRPSAGDDPLS
jgi:hypothetical protein